MRNRGELRCALIAVPYGAGQQYVPPLGLMCVGAYARASIGSSVRVEVYDFAGAPADDPSPLDAVLASGVDVLGFSVHSTNLGIVTDWARVCQTKSPDVLLVAGGPHVTLAWEAFTQRWGWLFDYTIAGEGERPFLAVLQACLQNRGSIAEDTPGIGYLDSCQRAVLNLPLAPLDPTYWPNPFDCALRADNAELVFTDTFLDRNRRAVALVTSRGCPYGCGFCTITAGMRTWRGAAATTIIEWLVGEHRIRPFEHIYFLDANFFIQRERAIRIAQLIEEALPGTTWSASAAVSDLLRLAEDLPVLKRHGLRLIEVGIESGSDRQLQYIGKQATVKDNLRAVNLLRDNGIRIGLDFIMFYPDQTLEDLRQNLNFLRRAHLTQLEDFEHYVSSLKLYPGTPLREAYSVHSGQKFDADEVPAPETLFTDPAVANIYELFVKRFAPRFLPRINNLLQKMKRAAVALSASDEKAAQRLRIETATLRHVPYKVLWYLLGNSRPGTLAEAIPWLDSFDDFENQIQRTFVHYFEEEKP